MSREWMYMPSDEDLSARSAWKKHEGTNTYSAARAHILVVKRKTGSSPKGPVAATIDLPANAELQREKKTATVVKYTEELLQSIQSTVTNKFSEEISAKIGSELGIGATGIPSAKLSAEVQEKSGRELTEAVQNVLSARRYEERQMSEELSFSIKYASNGQGGTAKTIVFYPRMTEWVWEFYLCKVEVLTLNYRKNWLLRDVRDSIKTAEDKPMKPLFRLRFYEAGELSMTDQPYIPELEGEAAETVLIENFNEPLGRLPPSEDAPLADLAEIAFPVTAKERVKAEARGRHPAVTRKAPSRKSAVKKASAKKTANKKTPRHTGRLTAAKRAVLKKGGPQRRS